MSGHRNVTVARQASSFAATVVAVFRVLFPAGMDANGYLCHVAEPEPVFWLLLESAMPMREVVVPESPQVSAESVHRTPLAADVAAQPTVSATASDTGNIYGRAGGR